MISTPLLNIILEMKYGLSKTKLSANILFRKTKKFGKGWSCANDTKNFLEYKTHTILNDNGIYSACKHVNWTKSVLR